MCDPGDKDFEVSDSQLTKRMKHFANVLNHFGDARGLSISTKLEKVVAMEPRVRATPTLLPPKWLLYIMTPYHVDYRNWDGFWK